ncbi:MAG: anti-sigma factor antagonist [Planctomycetes bacterium]|nr:anti-sigma factor antagonist [Planctomycetota bacterium]
MAELTFQVSELNSIRGGALIKLAGSIDASTVVDFQDKLDELGTSGIKNFILDLEGVKYVNSTALGALVKLADGLGDRNGVMALAKIHPKVKIVFDMLGLSAFFRIFPNLQSAQAYIESEVGAAPAAPAPPPPKPAPARQSAPPPRSNTPTPAPSPRVAPAPAAKPPAQKFISRDNPKIFACSGCGVQLKISQVGTFKCPKCFIIFSIAADGSVTYPSKKSVTTLDLNITCADECIEGVMVFAMAIAKKIGFSKERIREIQVVIHDTMKTIRKDAYDGDESRTLAISITPGEREFHLKIVDQGHGLSANQNGVFNKSKGLMDHFEVRPHETGGNIFVMTKNL